MALKEGLKNSWRLLTLMVLFYLQNQRQSASQSQRLETAGEVIAIVFKGCSLASHWCLIDQDAGLNVPLA